MFQLSKWYVDCVTEEGSAFIGYSGRLWWGVLTIPYAATLCKPAGRSTLERTVIRSCEVPSVQDGELLWNCHRLGLRGRWSLEAPGYHRVLHESADGSIAWNCHVPRARCTVDLPDVGRFSGLGYAEELTMTVRPDRLPFDEVRWGRFLSADDAVTWIEWRGRTPRQWVFHNGLEVSAATIAPDRVEWPSDRSALVLHAPVTIREGRLASTALRRIPAARFLLGGVVNAHEAKWVAPGSLLTNSRSSAGWAIHEIVRLKSSGHR